MEFSHRRLRHSGLSNTECLLCSYIFAHAGCSQDDAAQALKLDKTTATKALQSLEAKRLLERKQDSYDRRRKNLVLTAEGKNRIEAIADLHSRWFDSVFAVLTPEEQKQFDACCAKLLNKAESMLADSGSHSTQQ